MGGQHLGGPLRSHNVAENKGSPQNHGLPSKNSSGTDISSIGSTFCYEKKSKQKKQLTMFFVNNNNDNNNNNNNRNHPTVNNLTSHPFRIIHPFLVHKPLLWHLPGRRCEFGLAPRHLDETPAFLREHQKFWALYFSF